MIGDMRNEKVIWIVNQYSTPTAVRTRQIVLSQRLEEHGYQVYIICGSKVHGKNDNLIKDEKNLCNRNMMEHFIIIKIDDYTSNFKRVIASLQFQNRIWSLRDQLPTPDVIVSNFAGLFGNKFLKWKYKYGTKIIYDVLDLWPEAFIDVGFLKKDSILLKILYNMEHKSYSEANGIIFSFEGGKDYIIEKGWDIESGGDIDINKISYLNNGVDLESVDRRKAEFVLDDADLDSDKFKVVYLGAICRANNMDLIVETARVLQEREVQDIVVLVYGDGDYRKRLEDKVKELNLNNIKFKGRLAVEYTPNMLSRCNLNLFNFMNTPISGLALVQTSCSCTLQVVSLFYLRCVLTMKL